MTPVSLRGLYERLDGDDSMSDFTAERCRELVELGPQAYRRALGEAVCVSAVEETATNTLDNSLSLNTHTDYKISGGKHEDVIEQLLRR